MKRFWVQATKKLNKKILLGLITIPGLFLSSCGRIFHQPNKPAPTEILATKKDNAAFAYFNNNEYKLNDAVKDYLLTPTGLKTMVHDFVNLLITNFYESIPYIVDRNNRSTLNNLANKLSGELSAVKSDVQTKIDEINASANDISDPNKKDDWIQGNYDKFGGNQERFRLFNATKPLRTKFISVLMDHNYLNFNGNESVAQDALDDQNDWSKIKFSNDKLSDPVAKIFAEFQQFLFEDWYQYVNPLAVVQINWKYADANTKDNNQPILESIYNKNQLSIQGTTLPDSSNYQFPAFTNASQIKFKNFFTNYNSLVNSSTGVLNDLNNYTDDVSTVWKVYTLDDLGKYDDLSSQATAAILQIYNSNFLKGNDNVGVVNSINQNDVNKDSILNNFLKKNGAPASGVSGQNLSRSSTPANSEKTIKIKGDKLFKTSSDNKKPGQDVTAVYDFRQINDKKWILYKDKKGANILTIDGLDKIKTSDDFNKQMLLWRGMLAKNTITLNDKVNYNLFGDLKEYLEANFDQIILRYLIKKFTSKDNESPEAILNTYRQNNLKTYGPSQINTNIFNGSLINKKSLLFNGTYNPFWFSDVRNKDENLVNLLQQASNFLSANFFQNKLFNLRKKLTKDYAELLDQEPFVNDQSNSQEYYSNLNNGLSSRLPYDIAYSSNDSVTNYTNYNNINDGGFVSLEKLFFQTDSTGTHNKSLYNTSFKPGSLKTNFALYKEKVNTLFTTTFNNDLKFDSDNFKKESRAVHFADGTETTNNKLLIKPIINLLLESIKISGLTNKNLAQLIQQKSLHETVKKYFDYLNFNWTVNDNTSAIKNLHHLSNFSNNFKNNFALKFYAPSFFNEKIKQIFGGYQSDSKLSSSETKIHFIQLLNKIKEQQYFVNTTNGLDLLSSQAINDFKLFLTIDWLMNNDWANFRNYLLNFIGHGSQAGFVWLNQSKQNITDIITSSSPSNIFGSNQYSSASSDYKFNPNPRNELTSPFLTSSEFQKIDNFNTDVNNWSFADIKLSGTSNSAVGFKGLVKKEDAAKLTNDTVAPLLFDNFSLNWTNNKQGTGLLSKWGSKNQLIEYIKNIKTFDQLNNLVTELAAKLPNVDFANVERTTIKSPVLDSQEQTLTLHQRINALVNIVNGYHTEYRTGSEKIFSDTVNKIYNTDCSQKTADCSSTSSAISSLTKDPQNQFADDLFNRFSGSIENGISQSPQPYAIRANNSLNSYVVYMQQVNYADVINLDNFKKLLNTVSNDAILQVLFGAAQEDEQQKQALFNFLSGPKKLIVYDQQLAQALDPEWFSVKHQGGQ